MPPYIYFEAVVRSIPAVDISAQQRTGVLGVVFIIRDKEMGRPTWGVGRAPTSIRRHDTRRCFRRSRSRDRANDVICRGRWYVCADH